MTEFNRSIAIRFYSLEVSARFVIGPFIGVLIFGTQSIAWSLVISEGKMSIQSSDSRPLWQPRMQPQSSHQGDNKQETILLSSEW